MASGFHPLPDCLHYDLNPNAPDLDVRGDVLHLPFRDASIGGIKAVDIFEHVSYRSTGDLLAEWVRVLQPGGTLFIQTPDAESMMHWYLRAPHEMVQPEFADLPPIVSLAWRIMGGHADHERVDDAGDWRWNAHYAMFSESSLRWYLENAGLQVVALGRNAFPNLQARALKPH